MKFEDKLNKAITSAFKIQSILDTGVSNTTIQRSNSGSWNVRFVLDGVPMYMSLPEHLESEDVFKALESMSDQELSQRAKADKPRPDDPESMHEAWDLFLRNYGDPQMGHSRSLG